MWSEGSEDKFSAAPREKQEPGQISRLNPFKSCGQPVRTFGFMATGSQTSQPVMSDNMKGCILDK